MNTDACSVVLGSGQLGLAVVRELRSRDRRVLVINRSGHAAVPPGVEVVRCDLTDPVRTTELCRNAAVLYHCASPPYTRWLAEFPPIQQCIVETAASSGVPLIFGDNLYMYGPVQGRMTEDLPPKASGPNGDLRARMASMIMEAHRNGRIRAAIGRASDFFGPHVLNSHMGARVFGAALAGRPARILGNPDMQHTFTFIDDFARALVTLGEDKRSLGRIWHVPSAETLTTRSFLELIYNEAGTRMAIRRAPRTLVSLLAVVNPLMRSLKEQLYQFEQPFIVDHSAFTKEFGDTSTPHPTAIRRTLEWFRTPLV